MICNYNQEYHGSGFHRIYSKIGRFGQISVFLAADMLTMAPNKRLAVLGNRFPETRAFDRN